MGVPTIRVLLADDGPQFREAAQLFLRSQAHVEVVGSVESGPAAIEAVRTLEPDLVLMDLEMPGMTGIEATREIKRTNDRVRVVIVTLHDWSWNRDAAIAAGADGFISKASFSEGCRRMLAGWIGLLTDRAEAEQCAW